MKRLWSEFLYKTSMSTVVQQFVLQYTIDKLIAMKFPIVPASSIEVDDLTGQIAVVSYKS